MPRKNSRAAAGAGSIRQRPDGRWEARITVGTDSGTGKPIRRSIYGDTQAIVRKQMNAIIREIDNGTYQAPNKITVSQWMEEWITDFCTNRVKPTTIASYSAVIKNHINPAIGAMEIQAVRGTHIQRIYNTMTNNGLTGKTVKNAGAVLHKAFSVALKQGLLAANPCDAAELPKVVQKPIKPLTDEEIPRFLAAIDVHPFRNGYGLCLFAGLREGECLGLSWDNVDFENRRITVCQQLQKSKTESGLYYISASTKNGKTRVIAPPDIAFDYLREERRRQSENRLRAGKAWSNPENLCFTNETGRYILPEIFRRHFKMLVADIGRPDARVHDLRHTAATVAIASGADIKSVQDLMGHATASFTLNVYAHTSERMKEDTASRVQSYYDNLKKA